MSKGQGERKYERFNHNLKTINQNTSQFLTVKYYDSWQEQADDIQILVEAFEKNRSSSKL